MNKYVKKAVVFGTAAVMCLSALTGCGNSIKGDEVVATAGGEDITLGTANFFARLQQASYETYYAGMMGMSGEDMWNQIDETGSTYDVTVKNGLIDNLTSMVILRQHADEYGVSLSDEEKATIEDAADEFIASNDEEVIENVSGSKENIEEILELMTIQHKMYDAVVEEAEVTSEDETEAQNEKDNYFSNKVAEWKVKAEVSVDEEAWEKVDFNKIGFTMKEDN